MSIIEINRYNESHISIIKIYNVKTYKSQGIVIQVLGPVVDIVFSDNKGPKLLDSIIISLLDLSCCCEIQQLLYGGTVRTIALDPTDGVKRGDRRYWGGFPIKAPVGLITLGRIFNALGEYVDGLNELDHFNSFVEVVSKPIHANSPDFTKLVLTREIFETGIKVVDVLAPYRRGGKIGLFGGAGAELVFVFRFRYDWTKG